MSTLSDQSIGNLPKLLPKLSFRDDASKGLGGQLTLSTCESYAERLSDADLDIQARLRIVSELRESIETFQEDEHQRLVTILVPLFIKMLVDEPPVFVTNSPTQKLRNILLEIIQRLPQNDTLKQFVPSIMETLMRVLRNDNEENGCLALKIMVDLHKAYKAALEDWVQPFFDIVQEMYQNMDVAVREVFDESSESNAPPTQPGTPVVPSTPNLSSSGDASDSISLDGSETTTSTRTIQRSLFSFKVLTECPIIIALLFQLYRKFVGKNVPLFVPLIINCLVLLPAQQRQALADADAAGRAYVGVSPDVRNRAALTDFIMLQVKTVSFIAYILRSFVPVLKPYEQQIADAVVVLMRSCPPDTAATRKELLVATRHIWYTDFRHAFVKHVDTLLHEDVLVGTGVTARETLRPIAHSVLVDLIHHVRNDLSLSQLSRAIHMYSRNLHDSNFAPNIQTMCAKLLLNIVDCLSVSTDKAQGRKLLFRVLRTFASKFTSLRIAFPTVCEHYRRRKAQGPTAPPPLPKQQDGTIVPLAESDGYLDLGYAQPIKTYVRAFEASPDVVKDIRFLFRNMVQGLKAILNALRLCNEPAPPGVTAEAWDAVARGFSREDIDVLISILRDGLECFKYWILDHLIDNPSATGTEKIPPGFVGSKEEKENFEAFASSFTLLEPSVYQEIFSSQLEYIYDQILDNVSVLCMPQYFLASTAVAPTFAGLLLRFLVDRLDKLGDMDSVSAMVALRLFKLLFMSVSLFPDKNEIILRPQIGNIIMSSMKLSAKAKEPLNYFMLLRALFRSIGGGRFELLYQEVLPLLQVLLEGLNNLLSTAHQPHLRELFVELCLTVPVRLSVLLPHLQYLMKPLVLALEAGSELVSQGLRTLELCVDNLTQEFLEPIMSPVFNELMEALRKHLRPYPYPHQHSQAAVRILGKLGGRNRKFIKDPVVLEHATNREKRLEISFPFVGVEARPVALDDVVELANRVLHANSPLHFKKHAFEFAKSCVPLLLDVDDLSDEAQLAFQRRVYQFIDRMSQLPEEGPSPEEQTKNLLASGKSPFVEAPMVSIDKKEAHDNAVAIIIEAIFTAATERSLMAEAMPLAEGLCRHFALLSIAETIRADDESPADSRTATFTIRSSQITGFIEAVVKTITSQSNDRREVAVKAIEEFYGVCLEVLGSREIVETLPVFSTFASRFCSTCYQQEWFYRTGGCHGISILSSKIDLGPRWVSAHQFAFVKALIYVLKDRSPDMALGSVVDAKETLFHVLRVCNDSTDGERSAKFNSLISLLISELSDSGAAVRETVQVALEILAKLSNVAVAQLLEPVQQVLLQRIFAKPLRALPFTMQIGHIDAITYCLTLEPPILKFGDDLMRLISEALALADAEDQALVGKTSQLRNVNSLVSLRVVCIKLLSAAMSCADFQGQRQVATRSRIVSVFFKSLYSKSPEVVETAYKGLQQIINQQGKLPKEQLQAGLRPILVNLSDHKRLTVAGLEGLARLLELLTSYFKVEIGKKLLDHLRNWGTPAMLAEASGRPLTEVEDIKIMVAILNIFPLLPPTANVFMDDMIKEILDLEARLKRSVSSPFRPPLMKFLNRYPNEGVTLFLEKLEQTAYAELFADLLTFPEASEFRAATQNSITAILDKSFDTVAKNEGAAVDATVKPTEEELTARQFAGVNVVHALLRWEPTLLNEKERRPCLDRIRDVWHNRPREPIDLNDATRSFSRLPQYVTEILIIYLKNDPSDTAVLFDVMDAFGEEEIVDTGFIKQFLYEEVISKYSAENKRSVLNMFLEIFDDGSRSQVSQTRLLRLLITPMLRASYEEDGASEIVDADVISVIHRKIWVPLMSETGIAVNISDSFKVELLQFTALLVQYVPDVISETRKDVIKFAWNNLKVEDVICKQAAYVLLARFIEKYETPPKIVAQIYVALLRAHQSDTPQGRILVRQALDILLPMLPQRIGLTNAETSPNAPPLYVRWTRKIIIEDGHSFPQLVTIYQLITRYPNLFYDFRHLFVPQIVKSMSRLAFSTHATPESRLLTVDLCDVLIKWDRANLGLPPDNDLEDVDEMDTSEPGTLGRKRKASVRLESPAKRQLTPEVDSMDVDDEWPQQRIDEDLPLEQKRSIMSNADHEILVAFMMKIAGILADPAQKRGVSFRILNLVRRAVTVWPDVEASFVHFEKVAGLPPVEAHVNQICNAIEVLGVISESKPRDWVVKNITFINKALENWLKSDNVRIVKTLSPVIGRMYEMITLSRETDEHCLAFVRAVDAKIQSGLKSITTTVTATGGPRIAMSPAQVYCILALLKYTPGDNAGASGQQLIPDLVRLLGKLVKDHQDQIKQPTPPQAQQMQQPLMPSQTAQLQVAQVQALQSQDNEVPSPGRLVIMLLDYLKSRVPQMGENRRQFLQQVSHLLDFTKDLVVLRTILTMVREWIIGTTDSFPTMKEKANIMMKLMSASEQRGGKSFMEDYLELVGSIYADTSFHRTDLTVRLEQAFLLGTRNDDPAIRRRFSEIFNQSLSKSLGARMMYVLGVQDWEHLAAYFWLRQALDLLLGAIHTEPLLQNCAHGYRTASLARLGVTEELPDLTAKYNGNKPHAKEKSVLQLHRKFLISLQELHTDVLLNSLRQLLYFDDSVTYQVWVAAFPVCWGLLTSRERHDAHKTLVPLLAREYHAEQAAMRPNVIQALLEGICRCEATIQPRLPPQLVKYLGKTHNAWYIAIELLQQSIADTRFAGVLAVKEDEKIRESTLDALCELFWNLSEDDYFFGVWRRRSLFAETNAAVSFEQCSMWPQAQKLYEAAQAKARTGVLPFTESEYRLWEDHWVISAQKLQQWEMLMDLARHESNTDLVLECAWRLSDWMQEKDQLQAAVDSLQDSNPRRNVYQAFMLLLQFPESPERQKEFIVKCDEGTQNALRRWSQLPKEATEAHIPLLHQFQQYVELNEAAQIHQILATTTVPNISDKQQELKGILTTWRDRMPNEWDDITLWSDIIHWRQHVFQIINKAYLPLIPQLNVQQNGSNVRDNPSSYAFRGYHETAWTINRFAHVARKHQLIDVCNDALSKIYTLPNIEIHEAFYKLREQAKSYFVNPSDYATGLDVINNTNLLYFNTIQKAEFFALKGIFFSKLNLHNDAEKAFSSSIQLDTNLAKGWAAYAQYHDRMFKERPTEMRHGVSAVNFYLQAAAQYANARSRKFLARVLWLLSLDDNERQIGAAFDDNKSDVPTWYWITFIPQLISALSGKEAAQAKEVLKKIAKQFPQALYFQLRTARDEHLVSKKQALAAGAPRGQAVQQTPGQSSTQQAPQQRSQPTAPAPSAPAQVLTTATSQAPQQMPGTNAVAQPISGTSMPGSHPASKPVPGQPNGAGPQATPARTSSGAETGQTQQPPGSNTPAAAQSGPATPQQGQGRKLEPLDHLEEVHAVVKTAFPLLSLSMETMLDQIMQRLKPTQDEDIYRLIVALLNDGVQMYLQQLQREAKDVNAGLSPATEVNLLRFAESMSPNHIKYKAAFEQDFIKSKPNLSMLVERFRDWRDKLEIILDSRPKRQHLEHFSHWLVEFENQKFEDIEVPGQYFLIRDNNKDFVRIDRFEPDIDLIRGYLACHRRFTIRGHDGTLHPFSVQHPAARHCRREERIIQLFRILNSVLEKKKESRQRSLTFNLPVIVPLAPTVRLVEDDPSYVTLQDVWEDYCSRNGQHKDDATMFYINRMRDLYVTDEYQKSLVSEKDRKPIELLNYKTTVFEEVAARFMPDTILTNFMTRSLASYGDLWSMRKHFTHSLATVSLMAHLLSIGQRTPHKFNISRKTGKIWTSELLPSLATQTYLFSNGEPIPFRFTPNIQTFLTPVGVDGVFAASLQGVARALTEPDYELEDYLSIFIRDELVQWQGIQRKPPLQDQQLREFVGQNVDLVLRRTHGLACRSELDGDVETCQVANRTILDLIATASNPHKLAQMDISYQPRL